MSPGEVRVTTSDAVRADGGRVIPRRMPDRTFDPDRPLREVPGRIGDGWSTPILMTPARQPHRFSAPRREIPDVPKRMPAHTLRRVERDGPERDGLIGRRVFPARPPSVGHRPTTPGDTILDPLAVPIGRAERSRGDVREARPIHDGLRQAQARDPMAAGR